MIDAAASVRKFGEAMERTIADGAQRLARAFAASHGSHAKAIEWGEHNNGDWSVYISLTDGQRLEGRGGGKLDALADAESRL